MPNTCETQEPRKTEAEELAHSLRNVAAAMEGSLKVLDEAWGDELLVRTVRGVMGRQVEHLKEIVEHAARLPTATLAEHTQ